MTDKLYSDPEAYYTGPDLKQHVINKADDDGTRHFKVSRDLFVNEEAIQKYAEHWLWAMYGLEKDRDYTSASINDEGQIIFQPIEPIEYIEFGVGVVRKDENE